MDWLEISVTTDDEAAEAVVELFNRYGRGQAVIETPVDCFEYELASEPPPSHVVIKTYLSASGTATEAQRRIEEGLWHLRQIHPFPEPVFRHLAEADWAEAWKQQYHRQRVGQRIVIVPAWETYMATADEVVVKLEPGMAFGTGLHPTTRLCLGILESEVQPDDSILDVGTGSGILAIVAAKLGADSVLALDADPVAVRVAGENVEMNGVNGQVQVEHGSLQGGDVVAMRFDVGGSVTLYDRGQFDLVVINIVAPVIVAMAPALTKRLKPDGRLVVAGLIETQEQEVRDAFSSQGLVFRDRFHEKDWVGLVAQNR